MAKLKQFVGNLSTNCLSVFDHFVRLALKGLKYSGKHLDAANITPMTWSNNEE